MRLKASIHDALWMFLTESKTMNKKRDVNYKLVNVSFFSSQMDKSLVLNRVSYL